MKKSLLDQYPHLKNLLNENREKNSVALGRKKEIANSTNKKDISSTVTNKKDINSPSPIKKDNSCSGARTASNVQTSDQSNRTSGVLHTVDTNVAPTPVNTTHYPTSENLQVLQGKQSILGPGIGTRRPHGSQSSLPVKFTKQPLRKVTAETLFAESVASDEDPWLSFQIESIPASKQIDQLRMWLATNKPSQVERAAGIGWIAIKMTERPSKNLAAKAVWDATGDDDISMETVNKIAGDHGVTGGKWLCHVSRDKVDITWHKLAIALFSGGLGPCVYMIKVSPAVDDGGRNEHVICVYTPDYRDITQVMRTENLMRSAGVVSDLLYKPDIFSTLGIYRSNKWGFKASIYSSQIVLAEGRCKIRIVGSDKFYFNSSKGFENSDNLTFDQVTSQISASISKPTPKLSSQPTKEQAADEGLIEMLDKIGTDDNKDVEKTTKVEDNNNGNDIANKLSELGILNMEDMATTRS